MGRLEIPILQGDSLIADSLIPEQELMIGIFVLEAKACLKSLLCFVIGFGWVGFFAL